MSDPSREEMDLSPDTVAVVQAWLKGQRTLDPPTARPPELVELVGYLAGTLAASAAREVEAGLVATPRSRGLLRETRACLNALQQSAWEEVALQARGEDLAARVARAWLAIVAERLAVMPKARGHWLSQGWTAVRHQVEQGVAEAQAAWAACFSFVEQFNLRLEAQSLAPAASRSGPGEGSGGRCGIPASGLPTGLGVFLESAEPDPEGGVRVEVSVQDERGLSSGALSGQVLHLALAADGGWWPLASAVVAGDRAAWTARGLGTALGLSGTETGVEHLRVLLGDVTRQPRAATLPLLARVLDASGRHTRESPAIIDVESEPLWKEGQFTVRVSIPVLTRVRFASYRLLLDVVVSPKSWQRLGEWPLSGVGDGTQLLTASCPASPEAAVAFPTVLRAQVQP